ncbi:hypothetical protein [Streptomyces violaceusniger]|uniref:Uncharacterized protein n=1 Tax=Streptomyces violaceusniger TaxID=68280 RepID=A0A4D4KSH6_STRVO|nr:hypothetical protein SVIO_000210 [Streptomyces violaceusniger]
MGNTTGDELLDAQQIRDEFGISPSRLSELLRDRETTGCPEPDEVEGRRRRWKRRTIAPFAKDYKESKRQLSGADPAHPLLAQLPDTLLSTSQVGKQILGHKSTSTLLAWLVDSPGYFPEPDVVETTSGGRKRRFWQVATIVKWLAERPGPGNPLSKARATKTSAPLDEGDPEELIDPKQAAPILGYGSHLQLNRAIARGILPELMEPDEVIQGRITTNRWKRRRIVDLARARREAPSSSELAERRLHAALEALRTAGSAAASVTIAQLAQAHPGHGSVVAWEASLAEARRELGGTR